MLRMRHGLSAWVISCPIKWGANYHRARRRYQGAHGLFTGYIWGFSEEGASLLVGHTDFLR